MNADERRALFGPIEFLKGVGPIRAPLLAKLGLTRPVDLLFFFPRDYQDLTLLCRIDELEEGTLQTVDAVTVGGSSRRTRRGSLVVFTVSDGSAFPLEAVWFNQGWMYDQYAEGRRCLLIGKPVRTERGTWRMSHPKLIWQANDSPNAPGPEYDAADSLTAEEENEGENNSARSDHPPYLPVYPLTEGLRQYHLQRIIRPLLATLPDLLEEVLPDDFRAEHALLSIAEAVRAIHFPQTPDDAAAARRRFVYQELFILQLALGIRRRQHEVALQAEPLPGSEKILARFKRLVPYDLTAAQTRVIGEISADMGRAIPMNRLLQGDVGSGKTLVAAAAMLQAVANQHQAVLMAPTEILARQHLRTLTRLLENSRVKIASLFGAQKPDERARALAAIESGEADLIVGTQAIICNQIDFARLGLVVIDEQHKFGVMQRARLKTDSRFDPHYLVMTATPIPRSVTMTLFGDLDVSILDELPPGRQPVRTYVVGQEKKAAWWDFFRRKLRQGRQGYVVVPRVEEDDHSELKSVEAARLELAHGELASFRIGTLHGRMSAEEKEAVMLDFRSGALDVLVSTTVIEVGVDIPNATLMTIENGERFGLAQLHQLRGRIGRGSFPGFCAVFKTEKPEESLPPPSDEKSAAMKQLAQRTIRAARQRKKGETQDQPAQDTPKKKSALDVFAESNDGFYLAEKDLEFRGPGELFGTRQHGLCDFHAANLVRDQALLLEARRDAAAMLNSDAGLSAPEHRLLRRHVLKKYGKVLNLGDVG